MIYFFDTSSLVKRYVVEMGSKEIDVLFDRVDQVIISGITKLEALSAFKRCLVQRSITTDVYNEIRAEFYEDLKYFVVTPFVEAVENLAEKMINQYQLKTLDAIQLSSAIMHQDSLDAFIASDKKLKQAAEAEGLKVLDPLDGI